MATHVPPTRPPGAPAGALVAPAPLGPLSPAAPAFAGPGQSAGPSGAPALATVNVVAQTINVVAANLNVQGPVPPGGGPVRRGPQDLDPGAPARPAAAQPAQPGAMPRTGAAAPTQAAAGQQQEPFTRMMALQMMRQAGAPGAGAAANVAAGHAAFGAAGAAAAVLGEIKKGLEESARGLGQFGESVLTMNAKAPLEKLGQAAEKVSPIFGGLARAAQEAAFHLSDTALGEGRRLAQYSGELAAAYARIDVRNIQRDIERAQGPAGRAYAEHAEARADLEARILDLLMKVEPHIVTGLTNLVTFGERTVQGLEWGFNGTIDALALVVQRLNPDWAQWIRDHLRISLDLQREALRRQEGLTDPFVDALLNMRRPLRAAFEERAREAELRRNREARGTLFPGF